MNQAQMSNTFNIFCEERGHRVLIPVLGPVREQDTPARPTPQYRTPWPSIKGELLAMFTLTDTQQVSLSVVFTDKKGQPAKVDGVPEWLVDNPNVLALKPATDGLSCVVSAVGPLGTATVSLKADADLGTGVTSITGSFGVEVTGGAATGVTITPGTPTEQP